MEESLVTIYIEDLDGIYCAYRSRTDPYAGPKLTAANIRKDIADELCDATIRYNEVQALLCDIYNA
jgi:hypothetical protein